MDADYTYCDDHSSIHISSHYVVHLQLSIQHYNIVTNTICQLYLNINKYIYLLLNVLFFPNVPYATFTYTFLLIKL